MFSAFRIFMEAANTGGGLIIVRDQRNADAMRKLFIFSNISVCQYITISQAMKAPQKLHQKASPFLSALRQEPDKAAAATAVQRRCCPPSSLRYLDLQSIFPNKKNRTNI